MATVSDRRWRGRTVARAPETYFLIGAVFHYLGPSLAVLLFAYVNVLGVAWFRIVSAALILTMWRRRPWRALRQLAPTNRRVLVALGLVLALMNCAFYLAIARLPLGTVAAIEFLPVIGFAAAGARTRRNGVAVVLAVLGVYLLTKVVLVGDPVGVAFALANAALFTAYIVLSHRAARGGAAAGIDVLAGAMLVAAVVATPLGGTSAVSTFTHPLAVLAGVGVGICSSVIPYVTDQLAMSRIKRSTYALPVSLLPATAAIVGLVVLRQVPTLVELAGIALVAAGVGLHRETEVR